MHWLIVGNGTAHRKPTAVMSQRIHESTLTLLALVCATKPGVIERLWRELWASCPSYEALPLGSKELLPIAASHMQELGWSLADLPFPADLSSSVLLGKCKAIWARNALVLSKAQRWSRLLHEAGVEAVAIKGVVSISRDRVLARGRQTLDVDLLIPPEQWDLAEHTLKRSGEFREYDAPLQWSEGRGWVHVHAQHWGGDGVDLDLHRHPQPAFLEDTVPFALRQHPTMGECGMTMPKRGDHLAILMMHAFSHANAVSGSCFRYISEILRSSPALQSADNMAMAGQLNLHYPGTKIHRQIIGLTGIIASRLLRQTHSGISPMSVPLPLWLP
jgi:hypothetical protein